MSASRPGNMRGPRVKTPLLLLLLLLLTSLTGTVLCQSDSDYENPEAEVPETDDPETDDTDGTVDVDDAEPSEPPVPSDSTLSPDPTPAGDTEIPEDENGSGYYRSISHNEGDSTVTELISVFGSPPSPEEEEQNLGLIIIPAVVVLVVVIIGMIVCGIFISRRWNSKVRNQELRKEDPYLDDTNTEKVPMPMFEEDVPSVLELEMEELDQWMKKDSETAEDSKNP